MAKSTSWGQDVITCDLCNKPTQQFCNSCQVSLCDTCVKKHRDEFKSLLHDIVPFLDRKIQIVFHECQEHCGQRSNMDKGKELIIEIGGYRATMSPPSAGGETKHKILRYQGQNIKQEIDNDGNDSVIFKDGVKSLYMSENKHRDVCVCDQNANTVVVVGKTGRVRFRYDGTQARMEKLFDPRDIVTDELSQIIVLDYNKTCLHILDHNGQFLRCVEDCGLKQLSGLSLDSEGRLWVGCDRGEIKNHRDEFNSLSHDIVPFLDRKIQVVFPECQEHPGQRCEVNCKECNTPVCIKCIGIGPHKGHDVEELTETHENKIRKIKFDTEEIQAKLIPKYQKEDVDIGKKISKTKSKLDDLGNECKKLWHQEVDNIFDKLDSLNFPEHGELELLSLRSNIDQGKELIIEIRGYRATLKQMSPPSPSADVSRLTTGIAKLMDQVRVITTIPTNYTPICGIACVGEAEVFICGSNKTIKRIDIHGTVRDTVTTTCLFWPFDISVTKGRELIYSGDYSGAVKIVRHGEIETLITTPRGWSARGLCCTRSGDILAHMCKITGPQTKNKIIRYQGRNVKQEINKDGQGNFIFKDGINSLFMSENNNGDVCFSDHSADTAVMVDKTGRVRLRYDGTPARTKKSFNPRDIATDALSQIIVTDTNNNCLHILDQNGRFQRCVNECGLEIPYGLSVDSEGRLWVGLLAGEIKVIKYLEQS
ncbi:uncharacterized protein LOC144624507 [Crassostrea virginica]